LMDWRFNEFPNEGSHALHATCVEIMALPVADPAAVGGALMDAVLERGVHLVPPDRLPDWVNAVGLTLSNLPDTFWAGLADRLVEAVSSQPLSQWAPPPPVTPFKLFDPDSALSGYATSSSSSSFTQSLGLLLALAHAAYHHAGFVQVGEL